MKSIKKRWSWRNFVNNTTPPVLLVYTFASLILVGTILLCFPLFWREGADVSVLDAFFIAGSAACVTGLTTISVFDSFNFIGQLVILILFQFGGLGVMTFAAVSLRFLGSRLSMRSQAALEDTLYQRDAATEFQRTFHFIFYLAFSVELVGAALLTFDGLKHMSFPEALWYGTFHAVSAFCNAGFSLWNCSLEGQGGFYLSVIVTLIVLGGLGHTVLLELSWFLKNRILRRRHEKLAWFSYHTRVVMTVTGILLIAGTVLIYAVCDDNRPLTMVNSAVESVVARTAGFSTFSQTLLTLPAALVVIFLMFVGGAPGSCAGGIKVTSLVIWLSSLVAGIFQRKEVTLLGRSLPADVMIKVRRLINIAVGWNVLGIFILSLTEPDVPLLTLVFEQVSAFATVGLSMDYTPHLSVVGKLWIIASMFVGRLGPLTIALSVVGQKAPSISHPEGRIMIG